MSEVFDLIVATRDRHPPDHCSFQAQGGVWPPHCVDGTEGCELHPEIDLPDGDAMGKHVWLIDKATTSDADAYSGFGGTGLAERLRKFGVVRLVVCGLATDYCVRATVLDALAEGFEVLVAKDAVAAVGIKPGDESRALLDMRHAAATLTTAGQAWGMCHSRRMPTALLLVDVQRDFCCGGALAVPGAENILGPVNALIRSRASDRFRPIDRHEIQADDEDVAYG